MKLLTIFAIFLLISQIYSVDIECEYKFYWLQYQGYGCKVRSIKIEDKDDVKAKFKDVKHYFGYGNDDVEVFAIENMNLKKIPQDIGTRFTGIKILDIYYAGLEEISSEDLKQFASLKKLYLWDNKISHIGEKLFDNNKNIQAIILSKNGILTVADGVFDGLQQLHTLYFRGNKCFSDYVKNDPVKIQKLTKKIYEECKPAKSSGR